MRLSFFGISAASILAGATALGCGDGASSTGSSTSTAGSGGVTTSSTGGAGAGGSGDGGTTSATNSQTATGGSGGAGGAIGGAGGVGGSTGGVGGSTGGSGGTTTSSSSTTSTSSNTGSGSMLGEPCTWGDDCGGNLYCLAPGCGMGTCQPKPPPAGLSPNPEPVCGCDGVTYWSPDTAASKGQSVASEGACAMPIVCGPNMACPMGMKCNRIVADAAACSPDTLGECWGTAISCPLGGPSARACTTGTCELQCSLIQSQNPWYEDPTCL